MLPESDIQAVVQRILQREGGVQSDPADRGNAGGESTYYGITKPFAQDWNIPWPPSYFAARDGYRRALAGWKLDQLPDANTLDLCADSAINLGSSRAVKWLQRALGVNDDGVLGPQTLAAIAAVPQNDAALGWPRIYREILRNRIKFYGAIVVNDPSQLHFIGGWLDRATEFIKGLT